MMQEKINSFNAAFVDMAAGYVKHIANKMAGNTAYTTELPGGPLRWGTSLADEVRAANLLAATIGKMQAAGGGELPQGGPADGRTNAAGGQQPPPQAGEINLGKLYAGTRLEATERDEGKQPGGP